MLSFKACLASSPVPCANVDSLCPWMDTLARDTLSFSSSLPRHGPLQSHESHRLSPLPLTLWCCGASETSEPESQGGLVRAHAQGPTHPWRFQSVVLGWGPRICIPIKFPAMQRLWAQDTL